MNQFRAEKFTFDGYDGGMYGLYLASLGDEKIKFGTDRKAEYITSANNTNTFRNLEYNTNTIPIVFARMDANYNPLPFNKKIEDEIKRYLFQDKPKKLCVDDREYEGMFTSIGELVLDNNKLGYIKCDFEMSQPYVYSHKVINEYIVTNRKDIVIENKSTIRDGNLPIDMEIEVLGNSPTDITITNLSLNKKMEFINIETSNNKFFVDSANMDLYSLCKGYEDINMFSCLKGRYFLDAQCGINKIRIDTNNKIKIKFIYTNKLNL